MAAEHWFRWHHGTVTDPKWRVIASRCVTCVTVGHVIAVWAAMVENASQATPRGHLSGWDDEDIAVCLGFQIDQVAEIRQAMQGKVLDGETLSGWGKRQPNREDNSTERTREWRERQRQDGAEMKRMVTHGDTTKRSVTPETETETEKKRTRGKRAQTPLPENFAVSDRVKTWAAGKGFDRLDDHLESFRAKCQAKGYAYADWDSAFMEAIREDWAKLRQMNGANGHAPPVVGTPRQRRELGT